MKIIFSIIILFTSSICISANEATRTGPLNCRLLAQDSEEPIIAYMNCLANPANFDPNTELGITCNGKFEVNSDGQFCFDENGFKFAHCTAQDNSFCFDGKVIIDEGFSSNLNMMTALCTDFKLPKPGPPKWSFGPCIEEEIKDFDFKGLKVEDKMSCFCQDHGDGLLWTCYDVSP